MKELLKSCKQNINSGLWTQHSIRPKDKATRPSDVYDVFNLIYDRNQQIVRHLYPCKRCSLVIVADLHKGNHKLRRHKCYADYLTEKSAAKKAKREDDGDAVGDDEYDDDDDNGETLFLNKLKKTEANDKEENSDDGAENSGNEEGNVGDTTSKINNTQRDILQFNFSIYGRMVAEHGEFEPEVVMDNFPRSYGADDWYGLLFLLYNKCINSIKI